MRKSQNCKRRATTAGTTGAPSGSYRHRQGRASTPRPHCSGPSSASRYCLGRVEDAGKRSRSSDRGHHGPRDGNTVPRRHARFRHLLHKQINRSGGISNARIPEFALLQHFLSQERFQHRVGAKTAPAGSGGFRTGSGRKTLEDETDGIEKPQGDEGEVSANKTRLKACRAEVNAEGTGRAMTAGSTSKIAWARPDRHLNRSGYESRIPSGSCYEGAWRLGEPSGSLKCLSKHNMIFAWHVVCHGLGLRVAPELTTRRSNES